MRSSRPPLHVLCVVCAVVSILGPAAIAQTFNGFDSATLPFGNT